MLPKEEWLPQAKRLAVGMQDRLYHGQEHRPNLVVGNSGDRWWAYCQACKRGGVEMKEHVRIDVQSPERARSDLTMPHDMKRLCDLDLHTQETLGGFLATKCMDPCMLPPLYYSDNRKRLLLQYNGGWFGRDVTGDALEKWLTYNRTQYLLHSHPNSPKAVVVEDAFSFFKVIWATHGKLTVACALGTGIKDSLTLALVPVTHRPGHEIIWMFDGDAAGRSGARQGTVRLRGLGARSFDACAPDGKDPKDLTGEEIRHHLGEAND